MEARTLDPGAAAEEVGEGAAAGLIDARSGAKKVPVSSRGLARVRPLRPDVRRYERAFTALARSLMAPSIRASVPKAVADCPRKASKDSV